MVYKEGLIKEKCLPLVLKLENGGKDLVALLTSEIDVK